MNPRFLQALSSEWILIVAFSGALLLLGIKLTPDYGLYIDEFTNHVFGLTWYDYVRGILVEGARIAPLENSTTHDIVHGPVYEMTMAWLGRDVLGLTTLPQFVLFRHYANWGTFLIGIGAVFLIARQLGTSRRWALMACLFLVIHPRIFSHAFYDSVDISFLTFYTCSLFTLLNYLDRRSLTSLTIHGIACALTISVRSIGGVIPAITMIVLGIELIAQVSQTSPRLHRWGKLCWFPLIVAIATLASWPFLWNNPIDRIIEVMQTTPNVGWGGTVLYRGETILASELPWHYLPVWVLITTPITITILFSIGLIELIVSAVRNPAKLLQERSRELIVAATLVLPLAAVILMQAEVYDGWRHLFFIYPPFALIAMLGLRKIIDSTAHRLDSSTLKFARLAIGIAVGINLLSTGWTMGKIHPYQNVYFNRIAGANLTKIKTQYELDFWGLSYLEGLKHVVATRPNGPLKIYHGQNSLLIINRHVLSQDDYARIEPVEFAQAEFVLTTYRTAREGYPELVEIYSVEVEEAKIMTVYQKQSE